MLICFSSHMTYLIIVFLFLRPVSVNVISIFFENSVVFFWRVLQCNRGWPQYASLYVYYNVPDDLHHYVRSRIIPGSYTYGGEHCRMSIIICLSVSACLPVWILCSTVLCKCVNVWPLGMALSYRVELEGICCYIITQSHFTQWHPALKIVLGRHESAVLPYADLLKILLSIVQTPS